MSLYPYTAGKYTKSGFKPSMEFLLSLRVKVIIFSLL